MKLADLFNKKVELVESPQLDREVLPLKDFPLSGTSKEKMNRDYIIIYQDKSVSDITGVENQIFIALTKDKKQAVVGLYYPDEVRYQYQFAMTLSMSNPFEVNVNKFTERFKKSIRQVRFIQGTKMPLAVDIGISGLSVVLYWAVVDHFDCYLFSDMIQHPGGKGIWEKLILLHDRLGLNVSVFDTRTQDFLRDNDEIIMNEKLDHSEIWGDSSDKQTRILVLSKK